MLFKNHKEPNRDLIPWREQMRLFSILALTVIVIFSTLTFAQEENKTNEGPKVYMPYAKSKDHMVVGVEFPGYHMRYDLAQAANIFMVLLPDGFDDMQKTPVYFCIDTLSLSGYTAEETFEHDLKSLDEDNKGLKIVKRSDGQKLSKVGNCYGAEVVYPGKDRPFPFEVFYICKSRSDKYAILLSLGARDKNSLKEHLPNFLKWANAPQIVTDHKIIEFPGKD